MLLQKIVVFILHILIKIMLMIMGNPIENKKHFDFKLNGSLNGSEYNREVDFGYAFFS